MFKFQPQRKFGQFLNFNYHFREGEKKPKRPIDELDLWLSNKKQKIDKKELQQLFRGLVEPRRSGGYAM